MGLSYVPPNSITIKDRELGSNSEGSRCVKVSENDCISAPEGHRFVTESELAKIQGQIASAAAGMTPGMIGLADASSGIFVRAARRILGSVGEEVIAATAATTVAAVRVNPRLLLGNIASASQQGAVTMEQVSGALNLIENSLANGSVHLAGESAGFAKEAIGRMFTFIDAQKFGIALTELNGVGKLLGGFGALNQGSGSLRVIGEAGTSQSFLRALRELQTYYLPPASVLYP